MSERKDEKWLDEQLRWAIDGTAPVFDAESWKQKYSREFQVLLGWRKQPVGCAVHTNSRCHSGVHSTPYILRLMGRLALAAAVLVTAGILLVGRLRPGPDRPIEEPAVADLQSPAQMVSMISLSAAFRRGGIEELDRQCERALERLGPRPNSVSMQELLKDINSKG